jgi:type IV pilus assembly protein PilB
VPGRDAGLAGGGEVEVYEAVGCPRCGDSGYRGRIGLFEVMTVTDRIRSLIARHATASEMMQAAIEEGMRPLREDGLAKVRAGETSLAEVARVTD